MPTTIREITPLTTTELNTLLLGIEVEYSNGAKTSVKQWDRVSRGEVEIYVGDRHLVLTLINTRPETQKELERMASDCQDQTIGYLLSEGFIAADWIYIGLQNPKIFPSFLESENELDNDVFA